MGARIAAAVAAALTAAAQGLPAQEPPDSLAALRRARGEQAAFERFRYRHLPRTFDSMRGPCTERVGRWCFWFSPGSADRVPPEPAVVAERRGEMVHRLAQMAEAVPGEPWIVGQLVRYLVEGGDLEGALAVVRGCRAEPWWCRALEGYALHQGGRYPEAERAYAAALEAMPERERERWTDPTLLLRDGDRRALRRMEPAERAEVEARLWWLADPFWAEPGNDRLTEHYARWTIDRMQERARQVDHTAWAEDSREILLRYGWYTGWERVEAPFRPHDTGGGLVAHTADRSWEWLVPLRVARDPQELHPHLWPLEETAATATRYAPPNVRRMLRMDAQLARFRRPGRMVVVAGYALPADSLPDAPALRVDGVALSAPGAAPARSLWHPTAPAGALYLELAPASAVVSVEVRDTAAGIAARWREGVAAPGERISDLLLLDHPDARPESLEEAARIARGGTRFRAGERVAVYWEMYGLPPTDSLSVRLGLLSPRPGWVRRGLRAVGAVGPARAVSMRVREETPGGTAVARSLAVALPGNLRPGEYTLEVTVQAPGHPPATTRRTLIVVR